MVNQFHSFNYKSSTGVDIGQTVPLLPLRNQQLHTLLPDLFDLLFGHFGHLIIQQTRIQGHHDICQRPCIRFRLDTALILLPFYRPLRRRPYQQLYEIIYNI